MSTGIYIIESPTNKIYVGQSVDLKTREQKYAKLNCDGQMRIYRSIQKYGWDAHKFSVIMPLRDDTDKAILNWYEQFFMDYYRSEGIELLNLKDAGAHGRFSEESKTKMSKSHTGKIMSEEHRKKLSEAGKKRKATPETRARMRIAQAGKTISEEQKALLKSYAQNPSNETRVKMRMNQLGKKQSAETILKRSIALTGQKRSTEAKLRMSLVQQQKSSNRKLNTSQVELIRIHCINGLNDTEIGNIFNVARKTINDIRLGKRWSYVTGIQKMPVKKKLNQ